MQHIFLSKNSADIETYSCADINAIRILDEENNRH